jgi:hypothetical protein
MDMKRILQAMDGVATKPVVGANDMAKFLSIVDKNASVQLLQEGNPHKVSLPVQMAMQHYQKEESAPEPQQARVGRESVVRKYFDEAEQAIQAEQIKKKNFYKQYAQTIAERVLMKESKLDERSTTEKQARTMAAAAHNPAFAKKVGIDQKVAKEFNQKDKGTALLSNAMKGKKKKKVKENEISGHSMGFNPTGGPGMGNYVVDEAPLDFDKENPAASTIHSHQGVNPASIEARIMRARNQLKELAQRAESNDLLVWESISKHFPELAMNIEQIRHGIEELAKIRKGGGRRVHNIPSTIGENNSIKQANATVKKIKPKVKTGVCRAGQVQTGVQSKNGMTVPKCSVKKVL